MKLYEFITPSDPITFYAPDDDIAEAVGIIVGNGKAGVNGPSGRLNTMIAFHGSGEGQIEKFKKTCETRTDEVIEAAHTFAVCGVPQRKVYDEYTENGKNKVKIKRWDNKNRSSMSDWCGYARGLKIKASQESKL